MQIKEQWTPGGVQILWREKPFSKHETNHIGHFVLLETSMGYDVQHTPYKSEGNFNSSSTQPLMMQPTVSCVLRTGGVHRYSLFVPKGLTSPQPISCQMVEICEKQRDKGK